MSGIRLKCEGDQITHSGAAQSIISPPFHVAFPKLNRDQLEADQNRSARRQNNFTIDITMKGAQQPQHEFRAIMDALDEQLLELVHKNQHVLGLAKNVTKDQLMVMQRRTFREKSNPRNGRVYPDAMTCRSPLDPEKAWGVHVVDVNNEPFEGHVEYNAIVRIMLQYQGPYVVRQSMFGNSWRLLNVQVVGHAGDNVYNEPPPFPPLSETETVPA
jgi:hypothetical protein